LIQRKGFSSKKGEQFKERITVQIKGWSPEKDISFRERGITVRERGRFRGGGIQGEGKSSEKGGRV